MCRLATRGPLLICFFMKPCRSKQLVTGRCNASIDSSPNCPERESSSHIKGAGGYVCSVVKLDRLRGDCGPFFRGLLASELLRARILPVFSEPFNSAVTENLTAEKLVQGYI